MANVKISELTASSTPLAGTEVLPIVQSTATVKVSVANLTAGRSVAASAFVASTIGAASGNALSLQSNGTTNVTLDASGNMGVGVTPSATGGVFKAFQVGNGAAIFGQNNSSNVVHVAGNVYFDSSNVARYIASTSAQRYRGNDGAHEWYNAPTGTAGNAITFTQAMTLTADGNLQVGTTSSNPAGRATNSRIAAIQAGGDTMTLQQPSNTYVNLVSHVTTTSGTRYHIAFGDGTAFGERGVISTNGTGTTYGTNSDYRLKNTIAPMTGALAKVALLKPVTYKWNSNGSDGQGFIAHELQSVVPECVTGEKDGVDKNGKPVYQGIDTSFLVATLTAAIQELKAEFDAYKASHP